MKETYLHHGHTIALDLTGMPCARIRWTFFIDGLYCSQGTMESSSLEAVRLGALAIAHRSIDVLDSMRSGTVDRQAPAVAGQYLVSTMMDHGSQRFAASR